MSSELFIGDKWMSVKAVAAYLDVSEKTIRRAVKAHPSITRKKVGRQIRFRKSDIDRITHIRTN